LQARKDWSIIMNVRRLRKSQAKCWKYTTPSQFADKIEKQFRCDG